MKPWPNFFVIGAGKSGTTSLYHYLKQHPQIFMSPVKEPKFFAATAQKLEFNGPGDGRVIPKTITSEEAYLELFADAGDEPLRGEASTIYLGSEGTAENMARRVPHARLVAILRHPADRAYSAFMHLRRDGYETLESFQDALDAEDERIQQGYYYHWHLRSRGYYGRHLKPYFDNFPREQIRIFLYEDLSDSSEDVLAEIFRFLDVDDSFVPDTSARHNQSGVPRNQSMQDFLTRSNPVKEWLKGVIPERLGHRVISMIQGGLISRPELSPFIRARLTEDFRADILQLQDLIQRDLSQWLETH
jgi:hypothetical protein